MAKVSIIIPCYNAEKYIESCLGSLERQTIGMDELEVIFVNDASTDSTFQLLCDFEQKYPENVLVINCERNGRQGAARNIGLSYATSEYIGFADDDDEFEPDMFENMYRRAKEYNCDMVMCGYNHRYSVDDERPILNPSEQSDQFYEIVMPEERLAFITMGLPRGVWTKIYRRQVIVDNNVRFPEGYIYDDIYFTELLKQYLRRVYIIDQIYYHHIFREQSASVDNKRVEDMLGYLDVQLMLVKELERRGLYDKYHESYNEMLMLEAIGLLKTYMIRYGEVKPATISAVKERLAPYREEFLENTLLRKLWLLDEKKLDSKIAKIIVDLQ